MESTVLVLYSSLYKHDYLVVLPTFLNLNIVYVHNFQICLTMIGVYAALDTEDELYHQDFRQHSREGNRCLTVYTLCRDR